MIPAPEWAGADRLDRLVTLLDAASIGDGWFQPHRLVMLEADPANPTAMLLSQRVLPEGDHPLDHLLGVTAPSTWLAVGAICFGWAAPAGDVQPGHGTSRERPSRHPDRHRVRVVTLLDRAGNTHSTAALDDGTVTDEPAHGTISDALHRCLGLPTPPPPATTADLFAIIWLQGLLSAPRGISWGDAAARHPSFAWLRGLGRSPRTDDLAIAGRALADALDWPKLRASVSRQTEATLLAPDLATWMDDGMFARWVLANRPTLPELLQRLEVTLAPAFFGRVRRTLAQWCVPN